MTTEQFKIAFELRTIPQRNAHYMMMREPKASFAEELVSLGYAVGTVIDGEKAYRLNKSGRDILLGEWIVRNRPSRAEVEAM